MAKWWAAAAGGASLAGANTQFQRRFAAPKECPARSLAHSLSPHGGSGPTSDNVMDGEEKSGLALGVGREKDKRTVPGFTAQRATRRRHEEETGEGAESDGLGTLRRRSFGQGRGDKDKDRGHGSRQDRRRHSLGSREGAASHFLGKRKTGA
ncbi:hypothetical protein LY76DRAFT_601219 [Colletotrichum caudatum]|nr:hypothetical protein LY76DRAFT_601219 [Colletotrichum caudatum]